MERSDALPEAGEQARLAPVTYLPGVQPPDRSAHPSAGARAVTVRPSFAAIYNLSLIHI